MDCQNHNSLISFDLHDLLCLFFLKYILAYFHHESMIAIARGEVGTMVGGASLKRSLIYFISSVSVL